MIPFDMRPDAVMQELMAYGQKLSHGVQNLMEVGEISTGVTPKTVIHQEDKLTLFRFNPPAFQGVLAKEADLENTTYRFELEDGQAVEVQGNEQIEYDGEMHTAANLFDALKEGYYGKF